MGMFDYLRCEYPLPNPAHQNLEFQTKDLLNDMGQFVITVGGRLAMQCFRYVDVPEDARPFYGTKEWANPSVRSVGATRPIPNGVVEWDYDGDLNFYDIDGDVDGESNDWQWVEYRAQFEGGCLRRLWFLECDRGPSPRREEWVECIL